MNPCDLKVRYSLCRLADKPLRPKFLIVDCRSVVPENFQRHLISHFPTASVDYAYDSIARPGFDIYFVEADYIKQNTSRELIWNIKRLEKTALVIALSATNDLQRIDQFSRFGFAGVYGTDKPESSLRTRGAVHDHLLATNKDLSPGFRDSSRSRRFHDLLGQPFAAGHNQTTIKTRLQLLQTTPSQT